MHEAVWDGPLVPYVRTTQKSKFYSKPWKRYAAWKDTFRLFLNTKSFPTELEADVEYEISIQIFASKKVKYDLDNACKAVMDAAWKQDKQVKGITARLFENQGVDCVRLALWRAS
jgi:Holliday junction resolvase RusA-like endonuclease